MSTIHIEHLQTTIEEGDIELKVFPYTSPSNNIRVRPPKLRRWFRRPHSEVLSTSIRPLAEYRRGSTNFHRR